MFTFLNYAGMFVLTVIIILGFKLNGMRLLKKSFFWIALSILRLVLISFFGINPFLETLKLEALPREVMEGVSLGQHPDPPEGCPSVIKHVMLSCWQLTPKDRVGFSDIVDSLSEDIRDNRLGYSRLLFHSDTKGDCRKTQSDEK